MGAFAYRKWLIGVGGDFRGGNTSPGAEFSLIVFETNHHHRSATRQTTQSLIAYPNQHYQL
jgi:hypothetical protein